MSSSPQEVTVALYSRADLIATLPEVGDSLVNIGKSIDLKIKKLVELVNDIRSDEADLLVDVCEHWSNEEISNSIGNALDELNSRPFVVDVE